MNIQLPWIALQIVIVGACLGLSWVQQQDGRDAEYGIALFAGTVLAWMVDMMLAFIIEGYGDVRRWLDRRRSPPFTGRVTDNRGSGMAPREWAKS